MRRPLLINGTLLLLATVLTAAVWLSTEQHKQQQNVTLTKLNPNQVSQIVIKSGSGPDIRFEQKAKGWIMTQPSRAMADQAKIKNLLQISQSISIRRFTAPQNLAEFGLDPPLAVLTLNQTRIELGILHPMNQRRYIRVDNLIHLTNDRFYHLLQAPEKNLLPQQKQPPH